MYTEVSEYLSRFNDLLDLNLHEINEIEHILFQLYNEAYYKGMEDSIEDSMENL